MNVSADSGFDAFPGLTIPTDASLDTEINMSSLGETNITVDSYLGSEGMENEEEIEAAFAVVFPWFAEALGLLIFFILARWIQWLPYTAAMFVLGVAVGVGATRTGQDDQLTDSVLMWASIDSEVLLLVFLPGLVFKDAFHVNWHLFTRGLPQILLFAFPMMLMGTVLTALISYFIFPYNWSWFLSLTFGSILSATDPVAVAALLDEVGAPARLALTIGGESMFNDGSAMVFFNIFSGIFLSELNLEGLGEEVTLAQGFKLFFRLSLGGLCIGVAFAVGLVAFLFALDRKMNTENNVVQVSATVTVAYLAFYVSEITCECSGIIAVVICGITTKAFGGGFINDPQMMESFWTLLEHLLNTLLFTLGGVVWGTIIANSDERDSFEATDWGYLFVLYILLMIIRFILVGVFYPVLCRIGLKSNWQESVFMSYAGLRGAVGIALAIALDNDVRSSGTTDDNILALTNKLFGMVGGVAFLTLVINGTTSRPVLKALGLTKSSETHARITKHYQRLLTRLLVQQYAILLNDRRFESCSSDVVRYHVPDLADVTDKEIEFVKAKEGEQKAHKDKTHQEATDLKEKLGQEKPERPRLTKTDTFGEIELRHLFLELVRASYEFGMHEGYLDPRAENGQVYYSLTQSLEFAGDVVNAGGPIDDWKFTDASEDSTFLNRFIDKISGMASSILLGDKEAINKDSIEKEKERRLVLKAFAFQTAHQYAREKLEAEFSIDDVDDSLAKDAKRILEESKGQERNAYDLLNAIDKSDLENFATHYVCLILLNKAANYVRKHHKCGLLRDQDAHEILEGIDDSVQDLYYSCNKDHTLKKEEDESAAS